MSKGASARERTSSPSEADTLHALSSTRHLHHGICVCRSVALLFNLLARPTAPTATACLFRHKGMKERVRWRDVGTMLPRVLVAVRVFTQAKARAWTLTFTFNFLLFFTALCGALVRLNCVAAPTHSCCCPSLLEPSLPWSACLPLAKNPKPRFCPVAGRPRELAYLHRFTHSRYVRMTKSKYFYLCVYTERERLIGVGFSCLTFLLASCALPYPNVQNPLQLLLTSRCEREF